MKLYSTIFLLMIISSITCAGKNIERYYNYINKAELAIAESDYKSGLKFYKKAFKNHDEPFNYDYRNALLCSCQLQKEKSVKQYYTALKQRKFNFKNLEKHCIKNIGENQWMILEQLEVLLTIDTVYRKELVEILNKDQSLRDFVYSNGGYDVHGDTARFVDSLNMLALKKMIKEKGFPTDAKVGNSKLIFIPILHNRQSPNPRNDLGDVLKKHVQIGCFYSSVYARLHDEYIGNTHRKYGIEHQVIINGESFFDYPENETEINKRRMEIYKASMEEQRIKLSANKYKEGFLLVPYGRLTLVFSDDKDANDMIEGFKKIEKNYQGNKVN